MEEFVNPRLAAFLAKARNANPSKGCVRIDLEAAVDIDAAGMEPFGLVVPTLAKGAPANVCLVDLNAVWEVGEAGYESRSANCAFGGRRLTGRVRMTIAAGAVAFRERSFAIEAVR